jgi:hypothetical protein
MIILFGVIKCHIVLENKNVSNLIEIEGATFFRILPRKERKEETAILLEKKQKLR